MITCSGKLALPTLGSMRRQTASSYSSTDRRAEWQRMTLLLSSSAAVRWPAIEEIAADWCHPATAHALGCVNSSSCFSNTPWWSELQLHHIRMARGGACCSSNSLDLSCTNYCKCERGVAYFSHFTIKQMNMEDDEESLSASDDVTSECW